MRVAAWAKVCTAARPPGGCEPAGRLVHTTVGAGTMIALPARASWAAETASGAAKGAPGGASAAKTWLASKLPLSQTTSLIPLP